MGEFRPGDSPALLDGPITDDDMARLIEDGFVVIEDEEQTNAPLLPLTRRISGQYVTRFREIMLGATRPNLDIVLQMFSEVERLARTSGDRETQSVLSNLPSLLDKAKTEPPAKGGTLFRRLRGWVQSFASVVGQGTERRP